MKQSFYLKQVSGDTTETLVTGEFSTTSCQKDILTNLGKQIREYTAHGKPLPLDKKSLLCIKINYKDLGKGYDKDFVMDNLSCLLFRLFTLEEVQSDITSYCHLFETIRETKNTDEIEVVVNSEMVGFLKNYGNEDVVKDSREK